MNADLFSVLINYSALLLVLVMTVAGAAFARWSWLKATAQDIQKLATSIEIEGIVEQIDDPDDPPVLAALKLANALGLKVTAAEIATVLPTLARALVEGLEESTEITGLVQSKLD